LLTEDDGATTIAKGQDNTIRNACFISKDTCEIIFEKFSSKPAPKPLSFFPIN
jgi:hypothetical protein